MKIKVLKNRIILKTAAAFSAPFPPHTKETFLSFLKLFLLLYCYKHCSYIHGVTGYTGLVILVSDS